MAPEPALQNGVRPHLNAELRDLEGLEQNVPPNVIFAELQGGFVDSPLQTPIRFDSSEGDETTSEGDETTSEVEEPQNPIPFDTSGNQTDSELDEMEVVITDPDARPTTRPGQALLPWEIVIEQVTPIRQTNGNSGPDLWNWWTIREQREWVGIRGETTAIRQRPARNLATSREHTASMRQTSGNLRPGVRNWIANREQTNERLSTRQRNIARNDFQNHRGLRNQPYLPERPASRGAINGNSNRQTNRSIIGPTRNVNLAAALERFLLPPLVQSNTELQPNTEHVHESNEHPAATPMIPANSVHLRPILLSRSRNADRPDGILRLGVEGASRSQFEENASSVREQETSEGRSHVDIYSSLHESPGDSPSDSPGDRPGE